MESFIRVLLVLIPIVSAIILSVSPLGRRSRLKELSDSYSALKGNGYTDPLALRNISDAIAQEASRLQSKELKKQNLLRTSQTFVIWGMSFIAISFIVFTAIYGGSKGLLDVLRELGITYVWIAFVLGLIISIAGFSGVIISAVKSCWSWIRAHQIK